MPTRILIVGGGGREHALAWKLSREPGINAVIVALGSDAIADEPRVERSSVAADDLDGLVELAKARSVELVVVGPEAPLSIGLVDRLQAAGIAVFGPTQAAARVETSKAFCDDVARAAGIRRPKARAFAPEELDDALAFAADLAGNGGGVVLKADGLAAGKGVIVCEDGALAERLLPSFLDRRPAGSPALVVEERLEGREASVMAICDGTRAVALPAARDHKRLCDGDRGPNTGGMGAYSPVPELDDAATELVLDTVHRPLLAELARRGSRFRGFLYAGLMLTSDGRALLECNARLGDPEAQVILPRVAVALGPVMAAAARGALPGDTASRLPTFPGATVGIVLAAEGYPGTPKRGRPIEGLVEAEATGALVFHAGTVRRQRPEGGYGTSGGRVLTVVGRGPDITAARDQAERAADAISWDGMQRRRDIAADIGHAATAVGVTP